MPDLADLLLPSKLPTQIVTCTIEGIIEPDDLRELYTPREGEGEQPTPAPHKALELDDPSNLQRLRERHHNVARMIARGMSQEMTAMITGYTAHYIGILLNNPAMQELVQMYRIQAGAAVEVITEKLKHVGSEALEQISEKLEERKLSTQDLINIAKLGFDRSGHGPASKQTIESETHIYDHAALQELNRSARQRNQERVISVEEVRKALPSPQAVDKDAENAGG